MGTQQILMIVLSVIVVGAAVAVGIQMFDTQATNSQRTAIASDLQNFGSQVLAFRRTPASMGGGKDADMTTDAAKANLAQYLGFVKDTNTTLTNANAKYTLGFTDADTITITGVQGTITATATIELGEADVAKAITVAFTTT